MTIASRPRCRAAQDLGCALLSTGPDENPIISNSPQMKIANSPRYDIALALSHHTSPPLHQPWHPPPPLPTTTKKILHVPRRADHRTPPSTPKTNPNSPPRPRLQRLLLRAPAPRHPSPFSLLQPHIPGTPPPHQVHLPHRLQGPCPLL